MVQYFWLYATAGLGAVVGFCAAAAIGSRAVRRWKRRVAALSRVIDLMEERERRGGLPT